MRTALLYTLLIAGLCSPARADEPLPPPKPVELPAPVVILYAPPIPYRVSQYEVWQHYAVDRRGYFRPRVAFTPQGAFRTIDGAPYPWPNAVPRNFMPYAVD